MISTSPLPPTVLEPIVSLSKSYTPYLQCLLHNLFAVTFGVSGGSTALMESRAGSYAYLESARV